MSVYAIGDVQGCYEPLQRLLQLIHFDTATDQIWFVGDLVSRGPASLSTLRFVKQLGGAAVTVLGNHDLNLLAVAAGHRKPSTDDTLADVLRAPDRDELIDWLRRRPLIHRDEGLGFVMVHAGIPHIWSLDYALARAREVEQMLTDGDGEALFAAMYGDEPACWRAALSGMARMRCIINYLTRMRLIDSVGCLELKFKGDLTAIPSGYQPWFEFYRGASPRIALIFGHWAALNGVSGVAHLHALDTGCAWGNRLTALRLGDLERFSVSYVE
jgi:bis(5'-nucleosyl)-tetraphosphatase (symmetrical)